MTPMEERAISQPQLVGTTGDLYQGSIAETASREQSALAPHDGLSSSAIFRSGAYDESNYFKGCQWSPDGTTLLTSSYDNTLRTFILPPDLLSPPHPQDLKPYAFHQSPEPIYASAFHPYYNLQEPSTCLLLASLRALPLRLISPFAKGIVASYPFVNPTTEAYITPHSLLFSPVEPNTFFAGSESCISVFDINRDGEGPVSSMRTTASRRNHVVGKGGMKGIVSGLGMSSEGVLAAGTFSGWVGLYDGFGRGGDVGVFPVSGEAQDGEGTGSGGGVTQVLWSEDGIYLCVVERMSDGVGIWDIRGARRRLTWLNGRNAKTQQRLGVDTMGEEVWAGSTDGTIRVWNSLGTNEGVVDPAWEFRAHNDAVSATVLHPSGTVVATCSGQRKEPMLAFDGDDSESEDGSDESSGESSGSRSLSGSTLRSSRMDNSLKVWAL